MIYSVGPSLQNQQNFGAINVVCKNPKKMPLTKFLDGIEMISGNNNVLKHNFGPTKPTDEHVFDVSFIKDGLRLVGKDEKAEQTLFETLKPQEHLIDATITIA